MVRVFTLPFIGFGSFFFSNSSFFCLARDYKTSEESVGTKCENISEFSSRYCLFLFYLSLSLTFLEIFVRPKLQNLLEQIAIELRKSRKLFKCQRRRRDRILRPLRLLLASVGPILTESSTRRRYSLPASREPRASTERTEFNDPLGAKASERQRGSSATLEAGG